MAKHIAHGGGAEILEKGSLCFAYRAGKEKPQAPDLPDVERFHMVLRPETGHTIRLASIGRKRLPDIGDAERNWGFIQAVCSSAEEVKTLLLETGCHPAAQGAYAFLRQGSLLRLIYAISRPARLSRLQTVLNIAPEAALVVSITRPEPSGPKANDPFDTRRQSPQDPALLDESGTEFVLISADERATQTPSATPDPMAAHTAEVSRILRQLRFAYDLHPSAPLLPQAEEPSGF